MKRKHAAWMIVGAMMLIVAIYVGQLGAKGQTAAEKAFSLSGNSQAENYVVIDGIRLKSDVISSVSISNLPVNAGDTHEAESFTAIRADPQSLRIKFNMLMDVYTDNHHLIIKYKKSFWDQEATATQPKPYYPEHVYTVLKLSRIDAFQVNEYAEGHYKLWVRISHPYQP